VLLLGFTGLTYLPALDAPFAFDDVPNIVINPDAHPESWRELPASMDGGGRQDRPVARLTFGVNYLVHGLDPTGYRLANVLIHIGAALLLYALVTQLTKAPRSPSRLRDCASAMALAVALLWALHPVQTQAVTYIVQRMASLAALFYLALLLVFVCWRLGRFRMRWSVPIMVVLWGAAIASKGHTVTAPAALMILEVAFFTGWSRRNQLLSAGVVLGGAVGALAFLWAQSASLFEPNARVGFSAAERLLTEARVLWHYISLLLWPDVDRLQVNYDVAISHGLLDPPSTLLALIGLLTPAVLAVRFLPRWPWLAAGWLFWLVAHSVESSFIMLAPAFEHRIYLPSTLLFAGVTAEVFKAWPPMLPRWVGSISVLALAGLLCVQTMERNEDWANREELWRHDIARGADPAGVGRNAALAAIEKGFPERALQVLQGVEASSPKTRAQVNLVRAEALHLLGRYEQAEDLLGGVLASYPQTPVAQFLYTRVLLRQDRVNEAAGRVARMRDQTPESPHTALASAVVQQARSNPGGAIKTLRAWLDEHPGGASTQNMVRTYLAHALATSGEPDAARAMYREIIRANPQAWNAWRKLIELLDAGDSNAEANRIRTYLENKGIDPNG